MSSLQTWLAIGQLSPLLRPLYQRYELLRWRSNEVGKPAPHLLKERLVKTYARRYGLSTLVETGTYLGDMVAATRNDFASIHSIELDDALYARAQRRFANAPNVHLYKGDSGKILSEVVAALPESALFWLDAHHSGGVTARGEQETPILDELDQVLKSSVSGNVILIDDARDFKGTNGYPSIDDLKRQLGDAYVVEVADDVIRAVPRRSGGPAA